LNERAEKEKEERKKIGGKVLMNFFENHSVRISVIFIVIVCSRMRYGYKVRVREID
jgi:hypothetical protein